MKTIGYDAVLDIVLKKIDEHDKAFDNADELYEAAKGKDKEKFRQKMLQENTALASARDIAQSIKKLTQYDDKPTKTQ